MQLAQARHSVTLSIMSMPKPVPFRAGESLELRAQESILRWAVLIGCGCTAVCLCIAEWVAHLLITPWPLASTLAALVFPIWAFTAVRRDWASVVRTLKGARGERDVGELLAELQRHGYGAVHGVPILAFEDARAV